jgi:hypothetical protein
MFTKCDKPNRKRSKSTRTFDHNYIPEPLAQSFEAELNELISTVSATNGFKGQYLAHEYKSKFRDPEGVSSDEREAAAIAKWQLTERKNCSTNTRLLFGDEDFGWVTSDVFQSKAASFVAEVLGPLRYPDILFGGSGHTNGASTRVKRGPDAAILKHTGKAHVSSMAVKHWLQFASNSKLSDQCIQIMDSSVLFTVPKATDIDRVACKEPEINMLLQRSVGSHIRRRLRRKGINLNDQGVNKQLAQDALHLGLATIDLSAASDSITRQLVFNLLPFDWWHLLDDLRSHSVIVGEITHELEMFSSMGNGFTFELESLLFWAIARASMYFSGVKGRLSVYGDDIIVPCAIAPRLARIFHWFGFKVNSKKSYWSGSFRESCGGHYFRSYDVTPFYIKEPVRTKMDIIRLLNQLFYWDARGVGFISDPDILKFHKKWSRLIPRSLHGGQDPMDPSSLVTGDMPRKRLTPKLRVIKVPQHAALVCWFTKREVMEYPLTLMSRQEVSYRMTPQPSWTVATTWDPYLMLRIDAV